MENNQTDIFTEPMKSKNGMGVLLLIPILLIVAWYAVIPLMITFGRSFTNDNYINDAQFVGLSNYKHVFSDDLAWIAIKNTLKSLLLVTPITIGFTFLLAFVSSKLDRIFRYFLSTLFMCVSVTYALPLGLSRIISGDAHYLNGLLMKLGMIDKPMSFFQDPNVVRLINFLIPILLGLGPLYLLFTIGFIRRERLTKYFHIAALTQIVINLFSFYPLSMIVGYPSVNFTGHTLVGHIYDYIYYRFEIGYGSALIVLLILVLLGVVALFNGAIWLIGRNIKTTTKEQPQDEVIPSFSTLPIILFILMFFIGMMLMFPYVQSIVDSFKPLDELFAYPPKLMVRKPTFINYKDAFTLFPMGRSIVNTFLYLFLAFILYSVLYITSSLGISKLNPRVKLGFIIGSMSIVILSPIVSLTFNNLYTSSLPRITLFLISTSPALGLGIVISLLLTQASNPKEGSNSSAINLGRYILGLFSLTLLMSLSIFFNFMQTPVQEKHQSLFHIARMISYHAPVSQAGITAALYVMIMTIPMLIIMITVPILLSCLKVDKKRELL